MTKNIRKALLILVFTVLFIGILFHFKAQPGLETDAAAVAGGSSRLSELLSDQGLQGYAQAIEPHEFMFPDDHGPTTSIWSHRTMLTP